MKPGDRDKLGRRFNIKPKKCKVCEAEFQPSTGFQAYCSPPCRYEAEKVERSCELCGEKFRRPRSTGTRFCSPRCANKVLAAKRKGKPGRFGNGTPKPPEVRVCAICKQKFNPTHRKQHTCSRACGNKSRAAKRRETMGTLPPWSIRTKQEEACRVCGRFAHHLHHIVPRSKSLIGKRDVARNGMPLCNECHRGWHNRTVTIHQDCLSPEELAFAVEHGGQVWVDNNYPVRAVKDAGGLENARVRLAPSAYRLEAA